MSYTILPYSTQATLEGNDALNLQASTFSTPPIVNSKLYLGSKILTESNGNLTLGADASIVSATLDARFQAQTDATTMQKDRIDTILSGSDLTSDTLKEAFDFATAVKNLEVADVSNLVVKSELLKINQRTVCEVEPCSDIIADSSLAIKMHLTDSYKGWWVEKI